MVALPPSFSVLVWSRLNRAAEIARPFTAADHSRPARQTAAASAAAAAMMISFFVRQKLAMAIGACKGEEGGRGGRLRGRFLLANTWAISRVVSLNIYLSDRHRPRPRAPFFTAFLLWCGLPSSVSCQARPGSRPAV